jgi:hypothetical protein
MTTGKNATAAARRDENKEDGVESRLLAPIADREINLRCL